MLESFIWIFCYCTHRTTPQRDPDGETCRGASDPGANGVSSTALHTQHSTLANTPILIWIKIYIIYPENKHNKQYKHVSTCHTSSASDRSFIHKIDGVVNVVISFTYTTPSCLIVLLNQRQCMFLHNVHISIIFEKDHVHISSKIVDIFEKSTTLKIVILENIPLHLFFYIKQL